MPSIARKTIQLADGSYVYAAVMVDNNGNVVSQAAQNTNGRAAAAASSPVVLSNEDLAAVLPARTTTNRSLATSTTAANAMAANANRRGWKIKNDSAIDVWINFSATATAIPGSGNMKIAANGGYLASEPYYVETGALSIVAASGTPAITILEFT